MKRIFLVCLFIFTVSFIGFTSTGFSFKDLAISINNELITEFVLANPEKCEPESLKTCDFLISSHGIIFYGKNSSRIVKYIVNEKITHDFSNKIFDLIHNNDNNRVPMFCRIIYYILLKPIPLADGTIINEKTIVEEEVCYEVGSETPPDGVYMPSPDNDYRNIKTLKIIK
ncbi:MAG: hypothetical protein M0R46_14290 [Candidatus Muirbacterium halophilum]|nr:hypothetical protein [Candidatus Muirbacterium halophilum]MCK9477091.1 hypothetical protein [Candidatus Muirbacterium halophilum]